MTSFEKNVMNMHVRLTHECQCQRKFETNTVHVRLAHNKYCYLLFAMQTKRNIKRSIQRRNVSLILAANANNNQSLNVPTSQAASADQTKTQKRNANRRRKACEARQLIEAQQRLTNGGNAAAMLTDPDHQ
jgi:hypothetical protein